MEQDKTSRNEVIMAGIGGMGVLVAGQVLIWAALSQYKHVSYTPSYGTARRGGLSECTVIFSNNKIASPLLDQAQTVMLFDSSQFKSFETRVRPGGIIIAEKAGLNADRQREDYKLHLLPCMEIAVGIGERMISNLIMLGAYATITGSISPELIEAELHRRYIDKDKVLARNLDAFKHGLGLGATSVS
ncbi:2-oxoacid:acceptor oxidoreductase family protein [Chloroflexota bacterium]